MLVIGVLMLLISMVDMASDFFTLYSWAFASGIFVCWLPAIFIGSISKKVSEPAAYWSIIISLVLNIGYWLLTLTNPILPHQIYVALPASFIVLFVGMSRAAPTKAAEEGFWRMQSRQYKKVHGYVESK